MKKEKRQGIKTAHSIKCTHYNTCYDITLKTPKVFIIRDYTYKNLVTLIYKYIGTHVISYVAITINE